MNEELEGLGMKPVSGDSALFTLHGAGKLIGLVCIHVDNLFMAGNKEFQKVIQTKLFQQFQFSKVERNKFK